MKRFIVVILLGLIAFTGFASEESEFYTNLFNNALTAVDQLSVLRIVRDAEIEDAGSFYASALNRVLQVYPNLKGHKEIDAADESIRLIADQLTEDQSDTGQNLWRVVQVFSNPLVKADAIMALGKVGATDLLPQVVQILKDTNAGPYTNRLSGERIAYGAIVALENYKDPAGYLPVFFAANGWYPDWVRSKASESLPSIIEDPTEPLTQVIHSSGYNYDEKYLALTAIEKSEVDDGAKANAALAALYEGWKGSTNNVRLQQNLIRMRKLAIDMIGRYKIEDESVYPLLERSYRYGSDPEEHLGVVKALSSLATEDAANLLSSFIVLINEKLQRGTMTSYDERLMRALIPALGSTGNSAVGKPILRHVMALDWSYGIHNIAADALNNLGE